MKNDLVNRLGATLIQILLALGTMTYAPVALPGLPEWVAVAAGIVVGLIGVIVHVTGVQSGVTKALAQGTAVAGQVAGVVTAVSTEATKQFPNTNIDLTAPGHAEAQAAAPSRAAVISPAPQFDQPVS